MKKLLVLLFLTGCSYDIKPWELSYINQQCKEEGGIFSVTVTPNAFVFRCNSGLEFFTPKEAIEPKK